MNFRKLLVAGALSCSLALSSGVVAVPNHAFAVEFSDTQGSGAEVSINKLVALGVFKNPGSNFNPDGALTRADFAYMANQVASLSAGKKLGFKDLSFKNSNYTNVQKLVNNGYLTTSNGKVSISKGVTYTELAKFLAQNLGLKSKWTNRPIDHLFYLVRKDVLDIDTNLDEVVTREEAAAAFDKFITLKGTFSTETGIVSGVTDTGFTVNNGSDDVFYKNASNISVFVGGQATTAVDIQVGSPVTVIANKKGQAAFYSGEFLDAEKGPITLKTSTASAKIEVGAAKLLKDINIDAFVGSLPNNPTGEFTLKLLNDYQAAGAVIAGQAFFTNADEVTAIYPYIASATGKAVTVIGSNVTVKFSTLISETFTLADGAVVTLNGAPATTADLTGAVTADIQANEFGQITSLTAKK